MFSMTIFTSDICKSVIGQSEPTKAETKYSKRDYDLLEVSLLEAECDVTVPGIFHFSDSIGSGIGRVWYRKKVSEAVSEKLNSGADSYR